MKTLRILTLITFLVIGVTVFAYSGNTAMAQSPAEQADKGVTAIGGGDTPSFKFTVKTLIDTFLYIIGALAVVMIVYAGFKYVTSAGDAAAVASAKNTILYTIVGVIVAVLAYAIVGFVLDALEGTTPSGSDSSNLPPDCSNVRPGENC